MTISTGWSKGTENCNFCPDFWEGMSEIIHSLLSFNICQFSRVWFSSCSSFSFQACENNKMGLLATLALKNRQRSIWSFYKYIRCLLLLLILLPPLLLPLLFPIPSPSPTPSPLLSGMLLICLLPALVWLSGAMSSRGVLTTQWVGLVCRGGKTCLQRGWKLLLYRGGESDSINQLLCVTFYMV